MKPYFDNTYKSKTVKIDIFKVNIAQFLAEIVTDIFVEYCWANSIVGIMTVVINLQTHPCGLEIG